MSSVMHIALNTSLSLLKIKILFRLLLAINGGSTVFFKARALHEAHRIRRILKWSVIILFAVMDDNGYYYAIMTVRYNRSTAQSTSIQ